MKKENILIVEDELITALSIKEMLVNIGYFITGIAVSGDEAIKKFSEKQPDLVIMDIKLKGPMDGIEVAEELNKISHIPVIYLTAYGDEKFFQRAKMTEPFGYIIKPFEESLLHITIELALYKHKAEIYRHELEIKAKDKIIYDEQKKYRSHLEAIFRSVEDGIITVDRKGIIIEINDAAKKIYNISRNPYGLPFGKIITSCNGDEKCLKSLMSVIRTKETIRLNRLDCHRVTCPGQIISININPLIENDGEFSGAVMVIRDETHLANLERNLEERFQFHNIIGKNREMQKIYSLLDKLVDVPTTVLITGETGTGKELVAEALHYKSYRKNNPLVKTNCSALPENLLESELFGHVKGAFTGAIKDKMGLFEIASGGTIFLDEIGDISQTMQLRLLRVLQEGEFNRVGDPFTRKTNARVIAATNKNLMERIEKNLFREDLYYRLKVIEINLPPLRNRRDDIPLLTEGIIKKFNKKLNKNIKVISADVLKIFMSHSWPGNIRELEHTIEYAFILSNNDIITPEDIPLASGKSVFKKNIGKIYNDPEIIIEALKKSGGKKAKAARLLGITRCTLYRKMEEFNIKNITL